MLIWVLFFNNAKGQPFTLKLILLKKEKEIYDMYCLHNNTSIELL